jgi:hypothetical protein
MGSDTLEAPEEMVYVPLKLHNWLLDREDFLSRLEQVGVDNWEGYSEAVDLKNEEA